MNCSERIYTVFFTSDIITNLKDCNLKLHRFLRIFPNSFINTLSEFTSCNIPFNQTARSCSEIAIKVEQTFRSAWRIIYTVRCSRRHFVAAREKCIYLPFPRTSVCHIYQRLWQIILLTFAKNFNSIEEE